ncbi:hypothetical protein C0991_005506 [Blastosporella zonata]|nr:hypothetical protein C0991_005506 [Blastosporella zonata]
MGNIPTDIKPASISGSDHTLSYVESIHEDVNEYIPQDTASWHGESRHTSITGGGKSIPVTRSEGSHTKTSKQAVEPAPRAELNQQASQHVDDYEHDWYEDDMAEDTSRGQTNHNSNPHKADRRDADADGGIRHANRSHVRGWLNRSRRHRPARRGYEGIPRSGSDIPSGWAEAGEILSMNDPYAKRHLFTWHEEQEQSWESPTEGIRRMREDRNRDRTERQPRKLSKKNMQTEYSTTTVEKEISRVLFQNSSDREGVNLKKRVKALFGMG